jgi:hypothetical protein
MYIYIYIYTHIYIYKQIHMNNYNQDIQTFLITGYITEKINVYFTDSNNLLTVDYESGH